MTYPFPATLPPILPPVRLPRRIPGATLDDSPLEIYEEVRAAFPGFDPDTLTSAKSAAAMVDESYRAVEDRKKRGESASKLREENGCYVKVGDADD